MRGRRVTALVLACVACLVVGVVAPATADPPDCPTPPPNQPPLNPYLAQSEYPVPHGNAAQQDSTTVAGPTGPTRGLGHGERNLALLGPGHFGMYVSGPYADGRRVIWSNGINQIVKLDYDTFEVLATYRLYGRNLRDLSGVYAMLDVDRNFFAGGPDGITVYRDAVSGDPESDIVAGETYALPEGVTGAMIGMNMTFDGRLVLVTELGWIVAVERDFTDAQTVRMLESETAEEYTAARSTGKGWVRNAYAIGADGGVYVVSADHMHKVIWTGDHLSTDEADGAWVVPYSNALGIGSGATPSLMGFDGEDEFVVITDGDKKMNLVLYWSNEIPDDWEQLPGTPSRRVAGILPTEMGPGVNRIQSEQSVVVAGYGAAVVNNEARVPEWVPPELALLLGPVLGLERFKPKGFQKFAWNPCERGLEHAWTNPDVSSPNAVPFVSLGSDTVYTVGVRNGTWTLEGLDWWTGESSFHYRIGGFLYNSLFAGVILDSQGRIAFGTLLGILRIEPND